MELDYQYAVSDQIWLAAIKRDFAGLLFPRRTPQGAREITQPLLGVAALSRGCPVGLILADLYTWPDVARIISWCVAPGLRGCGIGSLLLARLEEAAREKGVDKLELTFRSDWGCAGAVRQILRAKGWSEPAEITRLFKIEQAGFTVPDWFHRLRLPPAYSVFPWGGLRAPQRLAIIGRKEESDWYPSVLSPFQLPQQIEPCCSLGLSYYGEVVGWVIAHRIRPDLVQYTSLFVSAELQPLGRAIPLAVEALKRQFAAGIPKAMFQVLADNHRFLRFIEQRLATHMAGQVGQYRARKEYIRNA